MSQVEVSKADDKPVDDTASQISDSKRVVVDSRTADLDDKPRFSTTKIELWAFYVYYIVSTLFLFPVHHN